METVEASFVRVPYEALKRAAKERKTLVDGLDKMMKELGSATRGPAAGGRENVQASGEGNGQGEGEGGSGMDVDVAAGAGSEEARCLDGVEDMLAGLRRRAEAAGATEKFHASRCRERLEHLASLGDFSKERAVSWNAKRMTRLIVDHLLRQGYHQSALSAIQADDQLAHFVDLDIFLEAQAIINALKRHECAVPLEWCAKNRSKLKRIKSKLEFKLHVRVFCEAVRRGDLASAVRYARERLSPWAGAHMHELQEVMATLVFGSCLAPLGRAETGGVRRGGGKRKLGEEESGGGYDGGEDATGEGTGMDAEASAGDGEAGKAGDGLAGTALPCANAANMYGHLFDDSQWDNLVNIAKQDFYQLNILPSDSQLATHIQAGLSALKTPMSYSQSCSKEDPLLLEPFRLLSGPLPFAKRSKSRLVCYITKRIMNEHNPPLVLPNGMVYSKEACEALAQESGDMTIKCPRTDDVFEFHELKRVFPV